MFVCLLSHNYVDEYTGSLATVPTIPNEVILCFGGPYSNDTHRNCENFNGQVSQINAFTLNTHHRHGCLALDNNMPTAIGGGSYYDYEDKFPMTSAVEA